ncbi:MAG: hypothetical protein Q7S09_01970 [bacterium]|nr:hypothetical protein [bacterium]
MTHLSGKDKVILFSTLWLVVGAGMILGVILPLYLHLQSFPERYQDLFYRLEGFESAVEKFSSTKSEFERISANIQLIRSQLLDPENLVSFIEAMEDLAREVQLYKEIQLISEPSLVAGANIKSSFVFQLTLVGSFEHLMEFIAHLENFAYAVDIEQALFSPIKGMQTYGTASGQNQSTSFKSSSGDIAASVRIRVYAMP